MKKVRILLEVCCHHAEQLMVVFVEMVNAAGVSLFLPVMKETCSIVHEFEHDQAQGNERLTILHLDVK